VFLCLCYVRPVSSLLSSQSFFCIYRRIGFHIQVFSFFYIVFSLYIFFISERRSFRFCKSKICIYINFHIHKKFGYVIGKFYWNYDKKLILFYSVIHFSAKIAKGYDQVFLCQGFENISLQSEVPNPP